MLSYLVLLSACAALGNDSSETSTFLEELIPETLTIEGIEDDSSIPILTQSETNWFGDYVHKYFYWVDKPMVGKDGFIKVHNGYYDHMWGNPIYRENSYACGMKKKTSSSSSYDYLTGLEIVYCGKYNWNLKYYDKFEGDIGSWNSTEIMCPVNEYIYGFFWVDLDYYPLVDLGFWCSDDTRVNVLYCEKCYNDSYYGLRPQKQWYKYYDRIVGFKAQISKFDEYTKRPGLEGFAVKLL
jgi:hypothetical protein